jgi:AcrR family transcriptional regulator
MVTESPNLTSEQTSTERHLGGRHLDATRDDALRSAALQLLAEIGYDRLTVDKVATLAGAGKATIYRRWSGKAEMVVDALMCEKANLPTPNTGTLRGDLATLANHATTKDRPLDSQVMIGLVSALPHDVELREVFRERLVEPHVATLSAIFERAVERGEIPPVENLDTVVSIFPALVLHRLLIHGTVPDQQFIESIIEGVILPLVLAGSNSAWTLESP